MKREINWGLIATLFAACLFWARLIMWGLGIGGCSWQGQRHIQDPNGVRSEWWSMRFLWMSNGIECLTETPYYKSGANIEQSRTDPNATEAVVRGVISASAGGAGK